MKYAGIIKNDVAAAPGVCVTFYTQGCPHHCPGCHNPETWDFNGGKEMTIDEILDIVVEDGVEITITGGDPFYQEEELLNLLIKLWCLKKNVWVYTGFTYEEIEESPCMKYINVLVDGPYIAAQREVTGFRGSSNQRIIKLH